MATPAQCEPEIERITVNTLDDNDQLTINPSGSESDLKSIVQIPKEPGSIYRNYSKRASSSKETKIASNYIQGQMKIFKSKGNTFSPADCEGDLEKLCFYRVKMRTVENILKSKAKKPKTMEKSAQTDSVEVQSQPQREESRNNNFFGNFEPPNTLKKFAKTVKNDAYQRDLHEYFETNRISKSIRSSTRRTINVTPPRRKTGKSKDNHRSPDRKKPSRDKRSDERRDSRNYDRDDRRYKRKSSRRSDR